VTGDLFVGTASGETWVGTAGDDSAAGNGGADNLSAGGGNDVVAGGDGDDTVNAGAGDDFIDFAGTNGGFDAIVGGAGVDEVRATSNPTDIGLSSISGVERISAGANPDVRIVGSAAANTLNFGAVVLTGIDSIDGGDGADSITGSAAADVINGQAGGDTLIGGLGADTLDGGTENDSLNGGAAADALTGGAGDDAMNGGADLDAFVYTAAFGNDTISGFDANPTGGQDRLDISGLGVTAANFGTRVTIGASPLGGTLITITDGAATVLGTIRLAGVALAAVNATDFILAP
jgi:Ca2+-binding RTX toxin-like protein